MSDMSQVITPRSDQLNSDSLLSGPLTIRIREVDIRPGTEQPVSVFYDGDEGKPWKPCKSTSRVLVAAWGPDASKYAGRSVTLYRDPDVKWGGMAVGGIRVSHVSHIEKALVLALTEKKGSKKMTTIQPLKVEPTTTLETATNALRNAPTMDALRTAWSSKAMAPFRNDLQTVLAECKAKFEQPNDGTLDAENPAAGEGRSEDQMGEDHAA